MEYPVLYKNKVDKNTLDYVEKILDLKKGLNYEKLYKISKTYINPKMQYCLTCSGNKNMLRKAVFKWFKNLK